MKPKVPVTEAPPIFNCQQNQFACHDDGGCIPKKWVCDDDDDCGDGSGKIITYEIHNQFIINNFVSFQMNWIVDANRYNDFHNVK